MPTYDYVCDKCGYEFEVFQSIKAEPVRICPKCGGEVQRKFSSGAGLLFKGSGFYITDYKKSQSSGDSKPTPTKSKDTKAAATTAEKKTEA